MASRQARFSDISLAFTTHPIKHDIGVLTDADAVKRSVMNLILTNHYERPFHPEIGSNVTKLLFENLTTLTAMHIQKEVETVIQNFEPRATLQDVAVTVDPERNGYILTIQFYVNNTTNLATIDSFLQRVR